MAHFRWESGANIAVIESVGRDFPICGLLFYMAPSDESSLSMNSVNQCHRLDQRTFITTEERKAKIEAALND